MWNRDTLVARSSSSCEARPESAPFGGLRRQQSQTFTSRVDDVPYRHHAGEQRNDHIGQSGLAGGRSRAAAPVERQRRNGTQGDVAGL
jgi:hypothetical protein